MLAKINGYNSTNNNYQLKNKVQNKPMTFGMEFAPLSKETKKAISSIVGKEQLKEIVNFVQDLNKPEKMKEIFQNAIDSFGTQHVFGNVIPENVISKYPERKITMVVNPDFESLNVNLSDQFSKNVDGYGNFEKNTDPVSSVKNGITEALTNYAKTKFSNEILKYFKLSK